MFVNPVCMDFFGKRLKKIRKKSGMSQDTLASELGISKSSLCYYENGERTPDIVFLEKVSVYYNVPMEYLMGYSEAMDPALARAVEQTGLSEESVKALIDCYARNGSATSLDGLIKNEKFKKAMELLECEARADSAGSGPAERFNPSYPAYIIGKLIFEAAGEVMEQRGAEIQEIITRSMLTDKERDSYYKWALGESGTAARRKSILDRELEENTRRSIEEWKNHSGIREEALKNLKKGL